MEQQKKSSHLPPSDWNQYMQGISADCVIFGYHDKELKILILEYKQSGVFALPGGFIKKDEALDDAAKRVLEERTGLTRIYLNQFHTFGNLERDDPKPMKTVLEKNDMPVSDHHFLLQRFISVGYLALVDFKKVEPKPDLFSDSCLWYDVNNLPGLMLDHQQIVQTALKYLRSNINNHVIGQNLLDETFTMGELQKLHETILDEKLHRTGFHRKMMLSKSLERLGKKKTGKAHRSPFLYRFKQKA